MHRPSQNGVRPSGLPDAGIPPPKAPAPSSAAHASAKSKRSSAVGPSRRGDSSAQGAGSEQRGPCIGQAKTEFGRRAFPTREFPRPRRRPRAARPVNRPSQNGVRPSGLPDNNSKIVQKNCVFSLHLQNKINMCSGKPKSFLHQFPLHFVFSPLFSCFS